MLVIIKRIIPQILETSPFMDGKFSGIREDIPVCESEVKRIVSHLKKYDIIDNGHENLSDEIRLRSIIRYSLRGTTTEIYFSLREDEYSIILLRLPEIVEIRGNSKKIASLLSDSLPGNTPSRSRIISRIK